MRLYEYQAKDIFNSHGITTPASALAENEPELPGCLEKIGFPCVLKAQVLQGGRGKAGLIRTANDKKEALALGADLFGPLHKIKTILVEQLITGIEKEIYLAVTYDPVKAMGLVLASQAGGIDIEETASQNPEKIIRQYFDITEGIDQKQCLEIATALNIPDKQDIVAATISKLCGIFIASGAELVEINPLFLTGDRGAVAGDGKIILDDNATYTRDNYDPVTADPEEDGDIAKKMAMAEGMPYLSFDGDIGLICAGAGLATAVYDLVNYAGGKVGTYLEFGGPNYRKAYRAVEISLLSSPKVILIIAFGTIARVDIIAGEALRAIRELKPVCPAVFCLRGTNEEKAWEILKEAGQINFLDTEQAVEKAVSLVRGGSRQ